MTRVGIVVKPDAAQVQAALERLLAFLGERKLSVVLE